MEKQHILLDYDKYKKKYEKKYGKNTIVFMQLGGFYELCSVLDGDNKYGELDIYNICNNILNIAVATKKNKYKISNKNDALTYLQAGFPLLSIDKYVPILLKHNYTIIIVDQVTEPPNPERKVTNIISPGIYIPNENNKNISNNYLMSIFIETYNKNKTNSFNLCGVSAIDLTTGKNYIHDIKYNIDTNYWSDEIFRLLNFYNPSEIIIHTENNDTTIDFIKNKWEINHDSICLNYFKDPIYKKITYKEQFINRIFKTNKMISSLDYLNLTHKNEMCFSYCYLLMYVEEHNEDLLNNIDYPKEQIESNNLILTSNSIKQLNIVDNYSYYKGKNESLLEICNKCLTPMGKRTLKDRLLYPLLNKNQILERYDKIELVLTNEFYKKLRDQLVYIGDIEKLSRLMSINQLQPNGLFSYYLSSNFILNIINLLKKEKINKYYKIYNKHIDNFISFYNKLKIAFNFDNITNTPINQINKSIFNLGIDENLDFYNETSNLYKNLLKFICDKLSEILNIENSVKYNSDKDKWFIYCTNKRSLSLKNNIKKIKNPIIKIPNCYYNLIKNEYKEINISNIDYKKKDSSSAILNLECINFISNKLFNLQKKICDLNVKLYDNFIKENYIEFKNDFKNINEYISDIDISSSSAKISIDNNYCKPNIIDGCSHINCKDIRHPIVEQINKQIEYVTNDINIGIDKKGMLLFGTNACGKSTFMKAIGLNLILAQSGLYTACSSFNFSPYKQIFTRILNNDNMFKSQSTFAVEIDELRSILNRANDTSLVLGDELCSGTETTSALSIVATGIYKLSKLNSTYIFTSHLHKLNEIEIVKNINTLDIYHLKIKNINGELIYDRKLCEGPGPSIYGLRVCEALGLDSEFMNIAKEIQKTLLNKEKITLSPYNKDILVDKCKICNSNAEETHHINEQQNADKNGNIKHFHKNDKHNLVPLCKKCHKETTYGKLIINGYIETLSGLKLNYYYNKENKQIKKKYDTDKIKIILNYKNQYLKNKTNTIKLLKIDHDITISLNTLKKIMNNEY